MSNQHEANLPPGNEELHPLSREYVASTSRDARKSKGQFFTPQTVRSRLLRLLPRIEYQQILDPSCGTGEFLRECAMRFPRANLFGWEIDSQVAAIARKICPKSTITVRDALEIADSEQFDLVIGNPPYFQIKCSPELKSRFRSVISGRPNIFSFFFSIGLQALKKGGVLAYVVPPSMNNGAYFQALRNHIQECAEIVSIEILDDSRLFTEAQTAVQLIVLRKIDNPQPNYDYIFRWGENNNLPFSNPVGGKSIFSQDANRIRSQFSGMKTLFQLGYRARTGRIVWNQNKHLLARNAGEGCVPLLWAHNLKNGAIELNENHKRPQYIYSSSPDVGPAIIVNRITGTVGRGSLRAAFVEDGMAFVGENHLNVIKIDETRPQIVGFDELLARLLNPEVQNRVQLITGNTQVSATELNYLIPI